MRTRDLRRPRLRDSVGIMIIGAVVALAGCAAQPAKTQGGTTVNGAQSAAPVASKPIDFHTLKETKCPNSAAS
jgi:membrane-bound lytic murein transglycosylase B